MNKIIFVIAMGFIIFGYCVLAISGPMGFGLDISLGIGGQESAATCGGGYKLLVDSDNNQIRDIDGTAICVLE